MDYNNTYVYNSEVSLLFKQTLSKELKNKKILDIGCGDGSYMTEASKNSIGLDISLKKLALAKNRGLNVKNMDLNNLKNLDESFDVIFSSHTLEHVENPIAVLKYARKHIKQDGKIIISVPNEFSLIHMVYPYYTNDGNHLYSFSIANMTEIFKVSGFRITNIYFDYYTNLTTRLHLNKLISFVNIFPKPIKYPFAWAFWFVGEPISNYESR